MRKAFCMGHCGQVGQKMGSKVGFQELCKCTAPNPHFPFQQQEEQTTRTRCAVKMTLTSYCEQSLTVFLLFFGSSHVSPHLRNLCVISRTVPKDIVGIEQFYWISFSFHTFSMGDTLGSVADRKGAGGCKAWLLNPLFTWLSQGKKIWGSSPAKSRVAHPLQAQGGTRPLSSVTSHRYKTHTSTKHL